MAGSVQNYSADVGYGWKAGHWLSALLCRVPPVSDPTPPTNGELASRVSTGSLRGYRSLQAPFSGLSDRKLISVAQPLRIIEH